jgi:hypothetical protein
MNQDTDPLDRAITLREFLKVIEPYNNAVTGLTSCVINVSATLSNSGMPELETEGDAVFKKLDSIIEDLELISARIDEITS